MNVNSLRHKTDLIYTELGNCDVIGVTETKLDYKTQSSLINIITLIEINFSTTREKAYSKTVYYDFDSGDYASATRHLQDIDWNSHFQNYNDINELYHILNSKVYHVMDKYIPKKVVLVRPRDKPWISADIKRKIRKRNRAHKKATPRNLESDWIKYRQLRNEVVDAVRQAKRQYLIQLHNSLVDKLVPPGKWWQIAKNTTTSSPIKLNGEILVHSIEKATAFNEVFCFVSTFDTEPDLPQVPQLTSRELSDILVSEQYVIDHFQILNIDKLAGPDKLPPKFLTAIFPSLVIFNYVVK
ncbi:unnamed protein product [Mytilus coruscus]|uniref:Reverse transcriptase domain-containing protein n=1 Tax=Mytilus coruscus TaxID=42192 RepID=A0A6J8ADB0_MYTCO|nr:unnamed protein product [Mytilus coruscus]